MGEISESVSRPKFRLNYWYTFDGAPVGHLGDRSQGDKRSGKIQNLQTIVSRLIKLKFHWDQFPRNFPVANVTGKSPTSYELVGRVGRVASLLRGS